MTTSNWTIRHLRYAFSHDVYGDALLAILALAREDLDLADAWAEVSQEGVDIWTFLNVANYVTTDGIRECYNCNEPGWDTDGITLHGGDFICCGCREYGDYAVCDGCGDWFHCEDTTTVGEDTYCDDRCLDTHCWWCEECDQYDTHEHDHEEEDDCCECEAPQRRFYFPANGHGVIREDERLAVELPAGTIATEGIKAIYRLLAKETYGMANSYGLWDTVDAIDPTWQTKRGNFTRRLSKAMLDNHQAKLPSHVISEIGNLARQHTSDATSWEVEFTRDLNQSASDFYHEESCWWGGLAYSRCAMKNWGGVGMRTFANESTSYPSGRAWVQPLTEDMTPTHDVTGAHAYVVYNGYGELEGYTATRIVAHLTGRTYRKIALSLTPQFINGDSGYLVADAETCANTERVSFSTGDHNQLDAHEHPFIHRIHQEVAA